MKILWISPWFGNYRIPVYEYIQQYTNGNFYLICSQENTSELVQEKLKRTLGDHVIIMSGEKCMSIGSKVSDFANSALVIKRQPGLYDAIKSIEADVIIVEGFGGWAPAGIRYATIHKKKLCMAYERTAYVERNSPKWRSLYRRMVGLSVDYFLINGMLTEEYLNNVLCFKHTPKIKGCMSADSYGLSQAVAKVTGQEKLRLAKLLNLKSGLTFLFIGQMVDRKGIKELLIAWKKHSKSYLEDNLIVIGEGVLYESLKQQFADLMSIHILGAISYDLLYQYYAQCDVFVMPTLEDNWCLVVPEAMACGKPIACSVYNGGHHELVEDGVNGFNFDPLEEDSIIKTLQKFHFENLNSMGEESIKKESYFAPDKAARRIFMACQEVYDK